MEAHEITTFMEVASRLLEEMKNKLNQSSNQWKLKQNSRIRDDLNADNDQEHDEPHEHAVFQHAVGFLQETHLVLLVLEAHERQRQALHALPLRVHFRDSSSVLSGEDLIEAAEKGG